MKVLVNHELCQGHARCYALAPELFELDDDGYIRPGDIDIPQVHQTLALRAVRACPECALALADDATAAMEG